MIIEHHFSSMSCNILFSSHFLPLSCSQLISHEHMMVIGFFPAQKLLAGWLGAAGIYIDIYLFAKNIN
jgi:hypothetical protein